MCFPNTLILVFQNMVEIVQASKTGEWFEWFHRQFRKHYDTYQGIDIIGVLEYIYTSQWIGDLNFIEQMNEYWTSVFNERLTRGEFYVSN